MNWVDGIIIGTLLIGGLLGYSRGLIGSLFSFLSYVGALIGAKLLSPPIVELLDKSTSIANSIENFVSDKLNALGINNIPIPKDLDQALLQDPAVKQAFAQNPMLETAIKQNPLLEGGQSLATTLANSILTVIVMVAAFIVLKLIITYVGHLLNKSAKHSKTVNTANKWSGLIFGSLAALVIVFVVLTVAAPFAVTSGGSVGKALAESRLAQLLLSYKALLPFGG